MKALELLVICYCFLECFSYLPALVGLSLDLLLCRLKQALFAVASPVVHEETGPSEANLFAGKCIVDQNQSPSKQVKPLGRAYRILKFRLAPDFDSPSTVSAQTQQVKL